MMELIGLGFLLMVYMLFDTGVSMVKRARKQRATQNLCIRHDTFANDMACALSDTRAAFIHHDTFSAGF